MENIEIWKDIPDYEGLYQVSNLGRVKSFKRNGNSKDRILKPSKNRCGYLQVILYKNRKTETFTVHRLVALAFISNPLNLPCINHKDENKENNNISNLEWCTQQYNATYNNAHIKRGLNKRGKYKGENSPMYGKHHTEETKRKIRESNKGKPKSEETKQKMRKAQKGKPKPQHRKPILQYTLDGVFIKEWSSGKEIYQTMSFSQGNISSCCSGALKSAYGFIWRYKNIA